MSIFISSLKLANFQFVMLIGYLIVKNYNVEHFQLLKISYIKQTSLTYFFRIIFGSVMIASRQVQ